MPLNINDPNQKQYPEPSQRGWRTIKLFALVAIGFIVYVRLAPDEPKIPPQVNAALLTNGQAQAIKPPAEELPKTELPRAQKPQAQAPQPAPSPRPVQKREKTEAEKMQEKMHLEAQWASPIVDWRGSNGDQHGHENGTTQGGEALQIPQARTPQGRNTTPGNVWNSEFYDRNNGQVGTLQYAGPYVIRRGWKILALLNEPINTDSPGLVTATVLQDIKDSATGKYLLIPHGSTLIGSYDSRTLYGQERVAVAWDGIEFPNGRWLPIPPMPGADATGMAGIPAETNNHLWSTAARSALLTITGAASAMATRGAISGSDLTASEALALEGGRELRQGSRQTFSQGRYRQPTFTVEAGETILVQVTRPLKFDGPYKDGTEEDSDLALLEGE